jgi:hypothetical protein
MADSSHLDADRFRDRVTVIGLSKNPAAAREHLPWH